MKTDQIAKKTHNTNREMHLRSYPSGGKTLQSGKEPSPNENDESKKKIDTTIFKDGKFKF